MVWIMEVRRKLFCFRCGSFFRCGSLLFDIRPKRRRADLYDFDEEYGRLVRFLREPLVVVRGLRRTGKTSLILTVLEEEEVPYILLDLREGFRSRRELYKALSKGLTEFLRKLSSRRRILYGLIRSLRFLRGVSISGFQIQLSWGRNRPLLTEVFREIDYFSGREGWKTVIVVDEVQRASGIVKTELMNAISYCFDYMENLTFILSGSEMGLLYSILGNPESPLYGRAYVEVATRKLTRQEAEDFLTKGFEEVGLSVSEEEIAEAVEVLDGIIGWLTYYGYSKYVGGRSLSEIFSEAVKLARRELENFLETRVSRRYRFVLKMLSRNIREWGALKRKLEEYEGRTISDRVLHEILTNLKKHSIINDKLEYTDPVVREAAKQL